MKVFFAALAVAMLFVAVKGDGASDWKVKYQSFTCHKGYTGKLTPSYELAERACRGAGITDQYCFRICLWNEVGIFNEGKYNEHAAASHIANHFDSADNKLIKEWIDDTNHCAKKHAKDLKSDGDYKDGGCEEIKPFHECLLKSRACKSSSMKKVGEGLHSAVGGLLKK